MSTIKNIESFIDQILDKKKWTDKEMELYNVLKKKVVQYSDRTQTYELFEDKADIIKNIEEQSWFINSKYKPILSSLLSEMEIETYENMIEENVVRNRLIVKFPRSKFWLQCYFSKTTNAGSRSGGISSLQYYFYLEDFNQVKKAYIAYHDSSDPTELKLPQLSEIFDIIKIGAYVSKVELVKLFTEIVLYFDESEVISKTHIGIQYPISLTYFLTNL